MGDISRPAGEVYKAQHCRSSGKSKAGTFRRDQGQRSSLKSMRKDLQFSLVGPNPNRQSHHLSGSFESQPESSGTGI